MNLLRLEQIIVEDRLSKANIAFNILNHETMLDVKFIYYIKLVSYLEDIKWVREENTIDEIITAVIVPVMSIQNTELLTVTMGKIARKIDGPYLDSLELAASLLGILSDTSMLIIELRGQHLVCIPAYNMDPILEDYIANTSFLPPMLVQPETVTNNYMSGHITIDKPIILSGKNHSKKLNLHSINNFNSIPYKIDLDASTLIEESDKILDTQEKADNFTLTSKAADCVYELINTRTMYFTHNYCSRGRTYCHGWQLNYQGNDYRKSLISLDHKEIIPNE